MDDDDAAAADMDPPPQEHEENGIADHELDETDAQMTIKDIRRYEKEKKELSIRIDELEDTNRDLQAKVEVFLGDKAVREAEEQVRKEEFEAFRSRYEMMKKTAGKFERASLEKDSELIELKYELGQAKLKCDELQMKSDMLEEQVGNLNSGTKEIVEHHKLTDKLKKQIVQVTTAASREQNELQNTLQSTRMLLEETRLEYDDFTEISRNEFQSQMEAKEKDAKAMREQFERAQRIKFENNRQVLREQQELVLALQAQFKQYRTTAEHLFMTEAQKMEGKLSAQSFKHEQEMRYLVRMKDLHYHQTVTSKDAKIMNLIEGTDLQAFFVKHEVEMEHMRRQHERDLDIVKEEVQELYDKRTSTLQNQIASQELDIEKAHENVKLIETRLEETLGIVRQSRMDLAAKENAHMTQMNEMQELVRKSQSEIDQLTGVRETLRHRIIRLKLKLRGEGKDDIESLTKRLTTETRHLSSEFSQLEGLHQSTSVANRELRKKLSRQRAITVSLKRDLHERTKELGEISAAFERYLSLRLQTASTQPATIANGVQRLITAEPASTSSGKPVRDLDYTNRDVASLRRDYERVQERLFDIARGMPLTLEFLVGRSRSLVEEEMETMAPPLSGTVDTAMELADAEEKFSAPSKLNLMLKNNEFVDQDLIADLHHGFDLVKQFKTRTHLYKKRDLNALSVVDPSDDINGEDAKGTRKAAFHSTKVGLREQAPVHKYATKVYHSSRRAHNPKAAMYETKKSSDKQKKIQPMNTFEQQNDAEAVPLSRQKEQFLFSTNSRTIRRQH